GLEQHALVEARAADEEVLGRPLAALVLAPGFDEPFAVRLETARRQHAAAGHNAFAGGTDGSHEAIAVELDRDDGRVIADLDAELLGAAVVGIDQRLAAAPEEGVGARN